jgi:hypothetical protein
LFISKSQTNPERNTWSEWVIRRFISEPLECPITPNIVIDLECGNTRLDIEEEKSGNKTAGFWSKNLLWNKPSLAAAKRYMSQRFNITFRTWPKDERIKWGTGDRDPEEKVRKENLK